MIIKSSKNSSRGVYIKPAVVEEEVKPLTKKEKKKKKTTPVIEELPVVEEKIEESEIEDLKPWFEEDIDD